MSATQGVDVEESQRLLTLEELEAWNITYDMSASWNGIRNEKAVADAQSSYP